MNSAEVNDPDFRRYTRSASESAFDPGQGRAAAIDALDPAERHLILQICLDGMSLQEVANRQGVSKTTIYNRLHAALERLKWLLSRRGVNSFREIF